MKIEKKKKNKKDRTGKNKKKKLEKKKKNTGNKRGKCPKRQERLSKDSPAN